MLNIVLLGLPGAGKGTQAARIVQEFRIPHISAGDIFRRAVQEKTPLGLKAQPYIDHGRLVPDEITIGMVRERLAEDDCAKGFLLDGFPRNGLQAKALDQMLKDLNREIDWVIYIDVDPSALVERLTGRRVCQRCGATYHITFAPPKQVNRCDLCGGQLQQRADDRVETVKERLRINIEQNDPILKHYESSGKLRRVSGDCPMDQVTKSVLALLQEDA